MSLAISGKCPNFEPSTSRKLSKLEASEPISVRLKQGDLELGSSWDSVNISEHQKSRLKNLQHSRADW